MFLVTFVLLLIFAACGGDDGGGGGTTSTPKEVFDPWKGVGAATLPEGDGVVTESVRVLQFGDGMTVSYDGSDAMGSEEVCRRQQDETTWYEVCMPLEDDPTFIAPASNAFVWHPLLFERFSTELVCRSWMEGEAKNTVECDGVLSHFGDEDFRCEAGVVNGDRALRCSDEWAVVVNGDTDDTKTICRVHTSNGQGRCLAAPKTRMVEGVEEAVPNEELILNMQRSSWSGYRSGQDNNRQFAQGESVQIAVPQDLPVGAMLSYYSRDEEICTVDNDGTDGGMGDVTIMEGLNLPTTCKIILKIEATGFADRVLFAELPVLKANDTSWADYALNNDVLYPGESVAAGAVSSTDPTVATVEYGTADESICTIDENGAITAVASGECSVSLTARAVDYLDKVIDKSVMVTAPNQFSDIAWSFPGTAVVGTDTAAIDAPVVKDADGNDVTDAGLTVTIAHSSGDCAYDGSTSVLSFSDLTECVVSISASGVRGYAEYNKDFSVTPTEGDMGLTWNGYTGSATFGAPAPGLSDPTTNPADLGAEYSYSASGGACEVDAATGALTLLGATGGANALTCEVVLSATRSGYADVITDPASVTIAKGPQELTAPTNPYGSAASVKDGEMLEIVNPPMGGHGPPEYDVVSGDCTVDSATGTITATASGSTACQVQVKWTGDDNYMASGFVNLGSAIDIASGTQTAPVWTTGHYANAPTVGAAEALASAPAAGTGDLEYRSTTPDFCSVDSASGAVTGVAVGDCIVSARFIGDASTGASAWTDHGGLTVGQGTHPDPAADAYGSSAEVAVGATLEFETDPMGYGDATYTTTTDTTCTVDEETGVVSGLTVGSCTIQVAYAGDDNYEAYIAADLQTIDVVAGSQVITISEPYGTSAEVPMGEDLSVAIVPTVSAGSGDGGTLTYRVKSGSENYCSVGETDGVITGIAMGDCIIEAMAASPGADYAASEWVEIATVSVGKGNLAGLSWAPGASLSAVGEELTLAAVNVGDTSATVRYEVTDAGETGCAFEAADQNDATAERTLTFSNRGRCVVTALADKSDYNTWEEEHSIDVDLGTLDMADGVWGIFEGGLTVGGMSKAPNIIANVPDGVSITYSLQRGERDCRLLNYRTGEVAALQVALDRHSDIARRSVFKAVQVPVVRFSAKTAGTVGNAITVTVEAGSSSDKKYTVVQGSGTPEVYDNVALTGLENAMSGSALVNVSVLDLAEEPANAVATALTGGTDAVKSTLAFVQTGGSAVGTFTAKTAGAAGNAISVTIEDGTDAGTKKYIINDGINPEESYDNIAIASLATALAGSGLVDVTVTDTSEEPANMSATTLVGGVDAVGADLRFHRTGRVEVAIFSARSAGVAGNDITVTIEAGAISGRKYTVTDGTDTEEHDDISIDGLEAAFANSQLVAVSVTDATSSNEPDNLAASNLQGGVDEMITTKCSIVGTAQKKGYRRAKSAPIEVSLFPGSIELASLPKYQDVQINPDQTVQLPLGGTLTLEADGHPVSKGGFALNTTYAVQGYESDGSTEKSVVCSMADDTSGTIAVGDGSETPAVVGGDICRMTITVMDPVGAYGDLQFSMDLVVVDPANTLTFTAVPELAYDAGLKLGVSAPLTPSGLPAADDASTAVTGIVWKYIARGFDANDMLKEGVCRVDGRLTLTDFDNPVLVDHDGNPNTDPIPSGEFGTMANPDYGKIVLGNGDIIKGDFCEVQAIGFKRGYAWYTDVAVVDLVVAGKDLLFTQAGTKPAYPVDLRTVTDAHATPDATSETQDDNGVNVTWSNWTLNGDDADGDDDTTDGDVCSLDPVTKVVTLGSAATVGDTCTITADAAATTQGDYYIEQQGIQLASWTLQAVGTFANIAAPTYDEDGLLQGGDDLAYTTAPAADSDRPITWTYAGVGKRGGTETPDICSVDKNTGTISVGSAAVATDTCEITASAVAHGYTDASAPAVTLTVKTGFDSLTWANFPTSGSVGDPAVTVGTPVADPVADNYAISFNDNPGCTYNETAGTLVFTSTAVCEATVTATKAGYVDETATFSVTASKGTIQVAGWGTYDPVTVGVDTNAPAITVTAPAGVATAYGLASGSVGCSVSAAGVVRGLRTGTGACKVEVTLSKAEYNDATKIHALDVAIGSQSNPTFAGTRYGGGPHNYKVGDVVVHGTTANPNPATNPPGGTVWYSTNHSQNCRVLGNGNVTIVGVSQGTPPSCRIWANFRRVNNKYNAGGKASVDFRLSLGDQTAPSGWSDHYGSSPSISVGDTLAKSGTEPTNPRTTPAGGALEYNVKSGGCDVDGESGEITANSAGDCVIEARFAAVANKYNASPYSDVQTITVNLLTQTAPAAHTGGTPYGGASASVKVDATLAIGSVAKPVNSRTNPAGGALKYLSSDTAVCTVDGSSGLVTGVSVGSCAITAVWEAVDGIYAQSSASGTIATITVNKGDNPGTTSSDHYANSVAVGTSISLSSALPTNGEGPVTYRVHDQANPVGGAASTACTVDQSDGSISGVTSGDTCYIHVMWGGNTNYLASDWFNISGSDGISVVAGSQSFTWSQTAQTVTFGDVVNLADITVPDGATLSYEVVSGNTNTASCSQSGGVVSFADDGSCQVRARVTRSGYGDWQSDPVTITVNPAGWTLNPGWIGYVGGNTVTVGVAAPDRAPVGSNPTASWTFSHTGDACSVNSANGALTIIESGSCTVTATAEKDGYGAPVAIGHTITVNKGTQSLTWGQSAASATFGINSNQLTLTALSVSNGETVTYHIGSNTAGCTVSGRVVSFTGTGSCQVTARSTRDHYNVWNSSAVTITVNAGTQSSITWGTFSGSLVVGGSTVTPSAAGGTGASEADSITYALKSGSETNCDLVTASSGEVRAKAVDLSSTKTCTIVGTATRANYAAVTGEISINLGAGTITVGSWADYGTLLVGSRVKRPAPNLTGVSPAVVSRAWSQTGLDSPGCTLNTGDGEVTGILSGTNNCKVKLTLSATGYNDLSNTYSFNVGVGNQQAPSGFGSNPYGSASPTVRAGATLNFVGTAPANPDTDPAGGALVFSTTGDCTIDTANGHITGGTAGSSCVVSAHYAAVTNKFNKSADATVATITVASITSESLTISWSGYSPGTVTWSTSVTAPALQTVTVSDSGSNAVSTGISFLYSVGSGTTNNSCTVTDAGVLSIEGAGTCQIVLTVSDSDDTDLTAYVSTTATATVTINKAANSGSTSGANFYLTSLTMTAGTPLSPTRARSDGEGELSYRLVQGETHCSVTSAGVVSATNAAAGEVCQIEAQWTGNDNYLASDWFRVTSVGASGIFITGTQTAPVFAANPYGTVLTIAPGEQLPLLADEPTNPTTGGGALEVIIQGATLNEGRTSDQCRVVSVTNRTIIGVANGECVVQARFAQVRTSQSPSSPIKYEASDPVTLATITVAARQTAPSGWSNPYGSGSPTVEVGGSLALTNRITPPNDAGSLEYRKGSSSTATNCAVNAGTGEVTAGDTAGNCVVEARYVATATEASSTWSSVDTVSVVSAEPELMFKR